MNTFQSSVSWSDENGDLLFYSNCGMMTAFPSSGNGYIWNANHNLMPNGVLSDSCGCMSSAGSGLVIQDFNDPDLYRIYMTDCLENIIHFPNDHVGLRYTTVDMSLDGGLGDVTEKGIHIYGDVNNQLSEGLTGTRHDNGFDYWLVTHSNYNDTFYVFLVNASGIAGPDIYKTGPGMNSGSEGRMEISPNGEFLIYGTTRYDFNTATGEVSNPVDLGNHGRKASFSPNSQFIYATDLVRLYQFDNNAPDLIASQQLIFEPTDTMSMQFSSIQAGPDCKLYAGTPSLYLGVIHQPNLSGIACNYVHNGLSFTSQNTDLWLPNYIRSDFDCLYATLPEYSGISWELHQDIASQDIYINIPNELIGKSFRIIDIQGKILHQANLENLQTVINISAYQCGIYLLIIEGSNQVEKIVR